MVIICTNNKELRYLMLHTKFHQNLPSGLWRESVFPYMDMTAILVM